MKLEVNENCICCGMCVSTCPEVFDFGDGKAEVVGEVTEEVKEKATDAMESCPVEAIVEVSEEE